MVRLVRMEIAVGAVKTLTKPKQATVTVMLERGAVELVDSGEALTAAESRLFEAGPIRLRNTGNGKAVLFAAIADAFVAICDVDNQELCDPTTAQSAERAGTAHVKASPGCKGSVRIVRLKDVQG